VDKSDFATSYIKPSAFMPRPAKQTERLETSVFYIGDLKNVREDAIWQLALDHVLPHCPPNKKLYGRADIDDSDIEKVGLSIERDDTPPRHANIIDWSAMKEDNKEKALMLANVAGAMILK
jgi:hypothetical protein